ncbi:MAG TPA: response regulator, partial [Pyrinomonadaceae bacterium]
TIQKVVSLTFGDEAMEVTTVGGGAEALEKLGESLPDIVLADVFMPEPNGYALCERIKTDERTRHIPVLLLVGTFEPFNEAEARRVGADEVLTKPFQSIRDLVNKVGGLLGGQTDEKTPNAEHHEEEATRDLSPFAADARAADPAAETTPAHASAPADVFADFDMDDATIQTTPAAAFDAQHAAHAPDFSEINEEERFSDRGETDEAFVLDVDDAPAVLSEDDTPAVLSEDVAPAPEVRAATASASAASSPANSHAASPVAESAFDAHASRAAEADDALLELGDITPSRAATDEADDFILDIGGDDDPFDFADAAPAHDATAEADLLFAEHAPTTEAPEAFALLEAPMEPEIFSHSQTPEETEMWASPTAAVTEAEPSDAVAASVVAHAGGVASLGELPEELEAPEMSESPSLLFANEPPATETRQPESFTGQEGDSSAQRAPVWDGDPVAASAVAHAGDVVPVGASGAYQPAEPFATDASLQASAPDASSPAASPESSQAASTAAPSLSPEMLDEVVRRVVAQMSEQVVREIAWEVVPDLAERLIRQRLQEEQTRPR